MANCCENVVHLEMGLRILNGDVHSAQAAVIPSAAWRVIWALGTMKNEKEEVAIEGLCPDGKKALNVVGLDIGYSGVGSKTVVPATAYCRLEVCPVEGLSAQDVCAKVRAHLDSHGFDDVAVKVV